MTLDRLWQLDPTTAASNSNFAGANIAENCAPSGINNALRALGVMIARDLAFQASAISSSVSTNIVTSSTGLYVPITGANAINSFGVVPNEQPSAAVFRILEFSSSASLSHGGSIFLSGGASRRTQPGDVMGVIHEGSGDQWRELFYSPADGRLHTDSLSVTTITNRSMSTSAISTVTLNAASISVTNQIFTNLNAVSISTSAINALTYYKSGVTTQDILQTVFTQTQTAASSSSTTIPIDGTPPTSSEGTQLFSVTFTPKNATSVLIFDVSLAIGSTTAGNDCCAALFRDTTLLALNIQEAASGGTNSLHFSYADSASNTTARGYQLRYGAAATAVQINTNQAGDTMGGKFISSMKITELL